MTSSPSRKVRHSLEQGSRDWLVERQSFKGLTASQVPTILSVSPYQARGKLLSSVVHNRPISINRHLAEEGHRQEELARPAVSAEYGCKLLPDVFSRVWRGHRLLASLDGYDEQKQILWECKQYSSAYYSEVADISTPLPDHFRYQLITQVLVCEPAITLFTMCGKGDHPRITRSVPPPTKEELDFLDEGLLRWQKDYAKEEQTGRRYIQPAKITGL